MAKFRRKPHAVEAEQWQGPDGPPVKGVHCTGNKQDPGNYYVVNAGGRAIALEPGDWVVLEPGDGQNVPGVVKAYPMKPAAFAELYEAAPE